MDLPHPPAALLFDFDGVIVQSDEIREYGFRTIFADEPAERVEELIVYHRANGGLSRYHKIRWYFGTCRGEAVDEMTVLALAEKFKAIMLDMMSNPSILVDETVTFLRQSAVAGIPMHVVSGSDQAELRILCSRLGIADLFISILGSPIPKIDLVRQVMAEYRYLPERTIFIGDAGNDHEAAKQSGLIFCGYNNDDLKQASDYYINRFVDFAGRISGSLRSPSSNGARQ
jgi:phosphoglycolate phosphatase-like HAD superfamily hydrolase